MYPCIKDSKLVTFNGTSVAPLLMASVNAYVAWHHALIYVRTHRSREYLSFACLALLVCSYQVCAAFVYAAPSVADARPWQIAQIGVLAAGAVSLTRFVSDYTRQPAGRFIAVLSSALVVALAWVALAGTEAVFTHEPLIKRAVLPVGASVTYNEAAPGPVTILVDVVGLAVFAFVFTAAARQFRTRGRSRALNLLFAVVVFFLAAVNDAALGLGLITSVYLIEYAFMGMVVLMAQVLSGELVRAASVEEALVRSEQNYREVFDATSDAIFVHDADSGAVLDVNQAVLDLFGYTREEVLRLKVAEMSAQRPPFTQAVDAERIRQAMEEGPQVFEWLSRRKSGTEFWTEVALRGSIIGGERRVLATVRDITERKRAETELRRQLDELTVLNAVARAAGEAGDEERLIAVVTESVREALFPDDCGFLLVDEEAGLLRYTSSYRADVPGLDRSPIPLGAGVTGTVAVTGSPLRVDDLSTFPGYVARLRGMRSEICAPLKIGSRVLGVVNAESARLAAFTAADERILATVAGVVATAIGRLRAAHALVASEERFRRLAESAFEGIGITDHGRIVDVNSRLAEMLGYRPAEMVGRPVLDFMAPESVSAVATYLKEAKDDAYEHMAIRKDGSVFPVETQGRALPGGGGGMRVAAVRDITERRRAEQKIRRQLERLAALRAIDVAIAGGHELGPTMELFFDQASSQLQADAMVVVLRDRDTGSLAHAASRGFRDGSALASTLPFDECTGGRAAGESRPSEFSIPPAGSTDARWAKVLDEGFRSGFCAPLIVKGRADGVLGVFFRSSREVDGEWLDFLEMLAGQLAIAIDNRALFHSLERTNQELARAYDTTLEGWSRALEHRDRETQGHSARVVKLSLAVGRAMGMSESEIVDLRRGALLHDIGKMGIPDSILLKPGTLTPEEWAVMRRHPEIAHDLLAPIEFLRRALDVPYCHHEHWDGSGYPRGLKGEQIPLSARIFAVVDAWDGLSHARPYHGPWPPEQVRAYLLNQSGRKFDPAIVRVFLEMAE